MHMSANDPSPSHYPQIEYTDDFFIFLIGDRKSNPEAIDANPMRILQRAPAPGAIERGIKKGLTHICRKSLSVN